MAFRVKKQAEEDFGHPSEDGSGRFPLDKLLRNHGFRIVHRKKNEEPVWERGGKHYRQKEALQYVPKQDREKAITHED